MAVYTDVPDEELRAFIADYDIGAVVSARASPRASRIRTSCCSTERGTFILTLYEKRVAPADLPFFIALMEHLAAHGIACPTPLHGQRRRGAAPALRPAGGASSPSSTACGRAASDASHCAGAGRRAGASCTSPARFPAEPRQRLSVAGWRGLFEACRAARRRGASRASPMSLTPSSTRSSGYWPQDLPHGVIHADLFPDNVFFRGETVSGLIDFYFACTDFLAYDLAICLNAWCFEADGSFNVTKARLLLASYRAVRPLDGRASSRALPLLARGSALRFLLTRLYDWLNHPPGALVRPKDPLEYLQQAALPPQRRAGLAPTGSTRERRRRAGSSVVEIFTDGACSGNPGPGRLGRGAALQARMRRELCGGESPTTNNRMELMAAIAALEALKRPSQRALSTPTASICATASRAASHAGRRAAGRPPTRSRSRTSICGSGSRRRSKPHKVEWLWVKGHAGHPENERADALARRHRPSARAARSRGLARTASQLARDRRLERLQDRLGARDFEGAGLLDVERLDDAVLRPSWRSAASACRGHSRCRPSRGRPRG